MLQVEEPGQHYGFWCLCKKMDPFPPEISSALGDSRAWVSQRFERIDRYKNGVLVYTNDKREAPPFSRFGLGQGSILTTKAVQLLIASLTCKHVPCMRTPLPCMSTTQFHVRNKKSTNTMEGTPSEARLSRCFSSFQMYFCKQ